ncbi:MAG TPA: hypothetical protein VJT50_02570 [Pyrinomonadaceae bacterium]|nr:hypothetical protein [Pyrinomonadaceae bacterium]
MKTTLSSAWTTVHETIPPLMFGLPTLAIVVSIVIDPRGTLSGALAPLGMFLAMTIAAIWWATRLKWVSVDQLNLYAAGWIKKISVPLSQVDTVYSMGAQIIVIRLRSASAFGPGILFLAEWDPSSMLTGSHPAAQTLRERVKRASDLSGAIQQIVGRERREREVIADFQLAIVDLNSRRRVNSTVGPCTYA